MLTLQFDVVLLLQKNIIFIISLWPRTVKTLSKSYIYSPTYIDPKFIAIMYDVKNL